MTASDTLRELEDRLIAAGTLRPDGRVTSDGLRRCKEFVADRDRALKALSTARLGLTAAVKAGA